MAKRSSGESGFSLIEAMVALAILAVAMLGALSGLVASRVQLRDGATRQYREQLLDASAQRWMLASKTNLPAPQALSTCTSQCNLMAIGAAPWSVDPTFDAANGMLANTLSTGAYFTIDQDGSLTQLDGSLYSGCTDTSLPDNSFCREVLVTTGSSVPIVSAGTTWATWPPPAGTGIVPAGAAVTTLWLRVSKKGDSPSKAVYFTESFVQ